MRSVLTLLLLLSSSSLYSQSFVLTPDGFKNKDYLTQDYIVVQLEDKNKQEIFNQVHLYISSYFASPKEVMSISGNDLISINAISPEFPFCDPMGRKHTGRMTYKMTFQFRDGRMKVNFSPVSMIAYFNKYPTDLGLVQHGMRMGFFKRNGDLTRGGKLAIKEVEDIPNSIIQGIKSMGESIENHGDNW